MSRPQDKAVCLKCHDPIENHQLIFEAPCGHDEHPSACFHPLCLMEWREFREDMEREIRRFIEMHSQPYRPDEGN